MNNEPNTPVALPHEPVEESRLRYAARQTAHFVKENAVPFLKSIFYGCEIIFWITIASLPLVGTFVASLVYVESVWIQLLLIILSIAPSIVWMQFIAFFVTGPFLDKRN